MADNTSSIPETTLTKEHIMLCSDLETDCIFITVISQYYVILLETKTLHNKMYMYVSITEIAVL
jgi:hypothetical protein